MAKTVVVVGTQWGDEGKGKITDYLAQHADIVARSIKGGITQVIQSSSKGNNLSCV